LVYLCILISKIAPGGTIFGYLSKLEMMYFETRSARTAFRRS